MKLNNRKLYKRVAVLFIAAIPFFTGAFNYSNTTALEQITSDYRENLEALDSSIAALKETTGKTQEGKPDIENIKTAFLQVRKEYKQLEYLLEYFDPEGVKDYLNGAPLLKIERNTPDMRIQEPRGLQVIEEILYGDDVSENYAQLAEEIELLNTHYKNLELFQQKQYISERNIFEAARLQLIRVASLGITGFDTPGSGNALEDAKNSLAPLLTIARAYKPQMAAETANDLEKAIRDAINYMEVNNDFDTFNRYEFIKQYLNPAFKLLKEAQLQLGIETVYEVSSQKMPLNYLADNLFDADLINVDYFSAAADKGINYPKAELGKYLFFDPVLSANNKRACASCHNPAQAFTDGRARSLAMDFKGTVARNAPTLINSVLASRYFYDLRTEKIENQFEHVITSAHEFNTSYLEIAVKLSQSSAYARMFNSVFPEYNGEINKQTISEALGAYLKTLTGFNSEFDRNIRNEDTGLSVSAINGFNLFMGKAACATCHFMPTFSGLVPPLYNENESEVLGVPAMPDTIQAEVDPDIGRFGGRTKEKVFFNKHAFKTVTVRNAALTAPYMHNGVFTSLEQVMDFYNRGGGAGIGIDLENQTLPAGKLNLIPQELKDIVAFIESLTDTAGFTSVPAALPTFEQKPEWNKRVIGGEY